MRKRLWLRVVSGTMSKPCIVIATFVPMAEHHAAVREALESVIPDVHQEAGCELYALHEETEGRFVLVEKWSSRELWREHLTLAPVARLGGLLEGLLVSPVAVQEMYPVASGSSAGVL